ncbi:anaphase-promoting complex subunit Cut9 [Vermiconidia calcicola]|uniref:Anaphase-promoting complex subunit Cut9 n=1 Tax=Vermiconidia calcicola TaxID=1690605 RepID=A0ACC3MIF4_9PEZI|nr:anaphase-promoting complex subunit Cut9 [Vermiconidia calcicola]
MQAYLRSWRQSAITRGQLETACFVSDKLLALTNSEEDAFALAQKYFAAGNYTRALSFLSKSDSAQTSPAARYLAAHCYVQQNKHEEALDLLGEKNPVHLVTTSDSARRKLQHLSNGLSSKQHGKTKLPSRTQRADRSEERDREDASKIKYEAGMCYLRGVCYAKQNSFDRAKECYKDAVRIDVQCFEAFDQLMKNSLMSPGEEWDFLESLNFDSIQPDPGDPNNAPEAADFTRNLYITRLSKYARPDDFNTAIETLSTHYHLGSNPDVLLSKAEILFTSSRYAPALAITSEILEADPYNFACMPLHLALLHQLNHTNALFALSHDLADTHPHEPCTWLAVGTYYLSTNRIPEARSYFSKASLMDPHFGPAWIGFAHTFAAEGEGDQAIAAYSTAARLFQGTHLPQLFLGIQEIALGNLTIAREYLTTAYNLCDRDPLLINEIGVVAYMEDDYMSAVRHFLLALSIAEDNEAPPQQNVSTRLNLAHALRRAGRFHEALEQFDEVIRLGLQESGVFASKGLVLLELEQPFDATVSLHEALAISPQDPIATDLLTKSLALLEGEGVLGGADEEAVDVGFQNRLAEVRQQAKTQSKAPRQQRRVIRQQEEYEEDGDGMDLDGASDPRRS